MSALTVDHDQLQSALTLAGMDPSAAEVHGVICGSICNQMRTGTAPDLRKLLTAGKDMSPRSLAPLQEQLEALLTDSVAALYSRQGEFQLLLAGEDHGLSLRVQSLADWCHGFLVGLLNDGRFAIDQLGADAAEVARDMISISEAEPRGGDEGSEWDLMEVEEYVRIGVQVIFEDIHKTLTGDAVSEELH